MTVRRSRWAVIAVVALSAATLSTNTIAQRATAAGGRIGGVVLVDDGGRTPIRGAIVTIASSSLAQAASVITDDEGAFEFAELPAGRFTISASKPPYLPIAHGARRPGRPGSPLALAAGQDVRDIALRLPRGGVVTGVLRDERGQPMPDVQVEALPVTPGPPRGLTSMATTDDRGAYRIYGLWPGDYVVGASLWHAGLGDLAIPTTAEVDRLFAELQRPRTTAGAAAPATAVTPQPAYGYAPIYYPGTANASAAERLTIGAGDERRADFAFFPVRAGSLNGIVRMYDGSPPPAVVPSLDFAGTLVYPTQRATLASRDPDGRFTFTGVMPGSYVLSARVERRAADGQPDVLWAMTEVTSTGDDLTGVTLTLQPGLRLSGRVLFDASTLAAPDMTNVHVEIVSTRPRVFPNLSNTAPPASIRVSLNADGTFQVTGLVPGPYLISASAGSNWHLRSAEIDRHEAVDAPVELSADTTPGAAIVTFSDRHSELSGTLLTAGAVPAAEYVIVAFSTNRAVWRGGSSRIQSARPGSDGHFSMRDLPAGEYFLAALTDVRPEDLADATFLGEVAAAALRITLADGEQKTQDLKIVGGS